MTPFKDIVHDLLGVFLQSCFVLLIIGQVAVCVYAFAHRRGTLYKILNLLYLCVSGWILSLILDGTFRAGYLGKPREFPRAVEFVYSLPWWIFAAAIIAETVVLILLTAEIKRRFDNSISYTSVKEALDLLPDGMGYYLPGGTPVLVNKSMTKLSKPLTGDAFANPGLLWEKAERISQSDAPPLLLPLPNGGTYLLSRDEVKQEKENFVRLTSEDISEPYRITEELRSKRAALEDLRRRYNEYSRHMIELERTRTIISARADVHSELGHALLLAKSYLNGSDNTDNKTLLASLRRINALLINGSDKEPDLRPCSTAIHKAEEIGVSVSVDGALPDEGDSEILLARAIDECSSNAAKHSAATQMTVRLERTKDGIAADISHNGKSSDHNQQESGGLRLLRYEIESAGGRMQISHAPRFTVIIELPDNKSEGL